MEILAKVMANVGKVNVGNEYWDNVVAEFLFSNKSSYLVTQK